MEKYPALFNEIECINQAYGWYGLLDALQYIKDHIAEYEGTQCLREFRAFCFSMGRLFA